MLQKPYSKLRDCAVLSLNDEQKATSINNSVPYAPTGLLTSGIARSAGAVAVILIIIAAIWYVRKSKK